MTSFRFSFLLSIIVIMVFSSLSWAAPESVMVYPLTIHAETSMEYVSNGVGDLMETTLVKNGIKAIRASAVMSRESALAEAKKNGSDALIMGSLTFLGESVSIAITLIDAESGQDLSAFSKVEGDKGKLLSHVESFVTGIAGEQMSVQEPDPKMTAVEPVRPSGAVSTSSPLMASDVKSKDLALGMVGLSIGDVNGDGKKDIVMVDKHNIIVFTLNGKTLDEVARIEGPSYLNIIHVDTFDILGKGTDAIVATAVQSRTNNVASYVYQWNGAEYELMKKNIPWFLNKGTCPFTKETVLIGQQQHYVDGFFDEGVKTLGWDQANTSFVPRSSCSQPLPRTDLYAYVTGDFRNQNEVLTIAYTGGDYLSMMTSAKDEVWSSSERFGGSKRFLTNSENATQERYYIQPRLQAGDFDQNGVVELVTLANKNASPRLFSNIKKFVEGRVVCLTWEDRDMRVLWTTRKISGYIPDFYIDDLDGDGLKELVYGVIPKKTSFFGKASTYLVVKTIASIKSGE